MHVSLDILADRMEGTNLNVVRCERRRGIVEMRRLIGRRLPRQRLGCCDGGDSQSERDVTVEKDAQEGLRDNVLYVATPDELSGLGILPRHLIVASTGEVPSILDEVPNLAVMTDDAVTATECLAATFIRLSNWDSRMLEAVAGRQGVDALLQIAAEQLDNPIALFDSRQALLAYAGELTAKVEGTIWDDVLLRGYSPIEFFTHEEQISIDRYSRAGWPYLIRPQRNRENEYLCGSIFVDRQVVGCVGLVDVLKSHTKGQQALVDLVCDRLQMAFAMRLGEGPGVDDTAYLLRSILNGNKADRGLISYHLDRLGWEEGVSFRLLVMPLTRKTAQSAGTENRIARIGRVLGNAITILYEESVVALVPANVDIPKGQISSLLGRFEMRCLVSEPFEAISNVHDAYLQCQTMALVDGDKGTVQYLPDIFERVLPKALERQQDPETLCDRQILRLARDGFAGDVERGRELVHELYVYLMRGCNSHRSARELFLHRNTFVYHMEQIERLLSIKLDELSTSEALFLGISCLVALSDS